MLLTGTWQTAEELGRPREVMMASLVEKGWLQKEGEGSPEYRITEAGSSAFRTPLPIKMPAPAPAGKMTRVHEKEE